MITSRAKHEASTRSGLEYMLPSILFRGSDFVARKPTPCVRNLVVETLVACRNNYTRAMPKLLWPNNYTPEVAALGAVTCAARRTPIGICVGRSLRRVRSHKPDNTERHGTASICQLPLGNCPGSLAQVNNPYCRFPIREDTR